MNRFLPIFLSLFLIACGNKTQCQEVGMADISGAVSIPPIPNELYFAGERVPLELEDVKESVGRELLSIVYSHYSTAYIMQLEGRYKSLICKILKEEGVPEDLYYLCIAESALQPQVSPANACGYWQFLDSTAKEFGLEVNSEVDQRYDIILSTRAAAAYFKKAYSEFGQWSLAAASYNIGLANVRYRVKIQSCNDYYNMQFPIETARYLFRAIAYKSVLNNPTLYGYNIKSNDIFKELESKEETVNGAIENWSIFASERGTNFKVLKKYNEWIRSNSMVNKAGKSYVVKVPKRGSR